MQEHGDLASSYDSLCWLVSDLASALFRDIGPITDIGNYLQQLMHRQTRTKRLTAVTNAVVVVNLVMMSTAARTDAQPSQPHLD